MNKLLDRVKGKGVVGQTSQTKVSNNSHVKFANKLSIRG